MRHDSSARSSAAIKERQTLMDEDIPLPFDLPTVARKKVSAAFGGGRITSDGGVMLLAQAERRLGIVKCVSSDLIRQCSWFSEAGAGGRDAVLTKSRDRGPPFGVRRPR